MTDSTPLNTEIRVLAAEDNIVNRDVLEAMLDRLGYRSTVFVTSGLGAIEAFAAQPYDLILIDCHMPEIDGYEATRRIRAIEKARGRDQKPVVIIAVTGDSMIENRELCSKAGMDDLLIKPFNVADLTMTLQRWLPSQSQALPNTQPPVAAITGDIAGGMS